MTRRVNARVCHPTVSLELTQTGFRQMQFMCWSHTVHTNTTNSPFRKTYFMDWDWSNIYPHNKHPFQAEWAQNVIGVPFINPRKNLCHHKLVVLNKLPFLCVSCDISHAYDLDEHELMNKWPRAYMRTSVISARLFGHLFILMSSSILYSTVRKNLDTGAICSFGSVLQHYGFRMKQ